MSSIGQSSSQNNINRIGSRGGAGGIGGSTTNISNVNTSIGHLASGGGGSSAVRLIKVNALRFHGDRHVVLVTPVNITL